MSTRRRSPLREGVYLAAITADVSEARMARYFRPEGDHFRVSAEIRDTVVSIVQGGLGQEEHRRKTKEAGFDRHLTKPADLATLHAVLRAATESRL